MIKYGLLTLLFLITKPMYAMDSLDLMDVVDPYVTGEVPKLYTSSVQARTSDPNKNVGACPDGTVLVKFGGQASNWQCIALGVRYD